ncbi:GT2 family glycosyltransferase [Microbacterium terrae]|nr:glycosyltransferase [Microbacterium terrae]MBP1078555.1 GT2 family glycosyltransferase [Microbacterium terrae]
MGGAAPVWADAAGVQRSRPEVVIVAYGAPALLREALGPLGDFAVTIVDNSSSPDIAAIADEAGATYWDPGDNLGFGGGVNHALARRRTPGSDVLLLNPDAVVEPETIARMQRALHAGPRIATVGPRQADPDGHPAQVEWPYPRPAHFVADAVKLGRLVPTGPTYVIGSVLMIRADALAEVGLFDDDFFLYAEEADWEYRAHRAGWRNVVAQDAAALHVGAGTSSDPVRREVFLQAGMERYLRKHHGVVGWQLARWSVVVGSLPRSVFLRGERRAAARARGALFARGPVKVEAAYRARPVAG